MLQRVSGCNLELNPLLRGGRMVVSQPLSDISGVAVQAEAKKTLAQRPADDWMLDRLAAFAWTVFEGIP